MPEQQPICNQCGKPAVYLINDHPLCVDCCHKMEQIKEMQFRRMASEINYLSDSMWDTVGLPRQGARFEVPTPTNVFTGNINHIKVNDSIVGTINTGTIESINQTISVLENTGNKELQQQLQIITEAIANSAGLQQQTRNDLLEQIDFLSNQVITPKEKRKKGVISSVLKAVGLLISQFSNLKDLWSVIEPLFIKLLLG